jgi:hypothetical protein
VQIDGVDPVGPPDRVGKPVLIPKLAHHLFGHRPEPNRMARLTEGQ